MSKPSKLKFFNGDCIFEILSYKIKPKLPASIGKDANILKFPPTTESIFDTAISEDVIFIFNVPSKFNGNGGVN